MLMGVDDLQQRQIKKKQLEEAERTKQSLNNEDEEEDFADEAPQMDGEEKDEGEI